MADRYSKYNDSELFHALKGNDQEKEAAFGELYTRYSQRVYAYCLKVVGNETDAQDIFQEAMLKFYDSAIKLKRLDNVPGYMLITARNICLNFKRDKKKTFNIDDYQFFTNDSGYEKKELLQLLSTALELLDFDYREAFVLRLYHGMTYKEIAEVAEISVSAAKNRVWRAKDKIKEILAPYVEDLSKIK